MPATKRLLLLAALLAAARAASADAPVVGPVAPSAPKIAFDRETHDFGVVRQEQDLKTEFTVKNVGGATLHVTDLKAGCGCSQPRLDVREIPPGGSAPLSVVFSTLTFSGPMSKWIHLWCDDPDRKMAELWIKVDVCAGIVLDPPRFYFGNVLKGTSPTVAVGVKWKDGVGRPFHLTGVEAPGMDLRFDAKPLEAPPWHGYTVTARFPTPPGIGAVTGTALVRTDDPDYPRISVAITAFVSGKVSLLMREVSFGFIQYGKARTIAVPCRPFSDDIDLGEVKASARRGRVQATATRVAGLPREWTILVTLPEDAAPGRVEDVVEVRTALPDEPVTEIAVRGEVLPKPAGAPLPAPTPK